MATSTIYLIRHGARFDKGNPDWKEKVHLNGGLHLDPPLSAIGHAQARETAAKLENVKVDEILVSPYLRTIQTAVPFAEQFGLPLCLEDGLSEGSIICPHVPNVLPDATQRYLYFPQIDTSYKSMVNSIPSPDWQIDTKLNRPQERFPEAYFERNFALAKALEQKGLGKTIVCVSHAASVVFVAALLNCNLEDIPPDENCKGNARYDVFAPLGVFELRKKGNGPWHMVSNGSTNKHLSTLDSVTPTLGIEEKYREIWRKTIFNKNIFNVNV